MAVTKGSSSRTSARLLTAPLGLRHAHRVVDFVLDAVARSLEIYVGILGEQYPIRWGRACVVLLAVSRGQLMAVSMVQRPHRDLRKATFSVRLIDVALVGRLTA